MEQGTNRFTHLIEGFLSRELSATQFESQFLKAFKDDPGEMSEAEFLILDRLFADVDAFCADPALRESGDLDENALRDACVRALADLRSFGIC